MRSEAMKSIMSDLETEDIEPLTDAAIGDDIVELRRTMDRLEFQWSRRLDLFARRRGYEAFGFVTPISWLRSFIGPCGVAPPLAS